MDDDEKGKAGRPFHKPTAAKRESVRRWKAAGISEPVIAHKLGIVQNTLRFHYSEDLTFARDNKKAALIDMAYSAAEKGSVAAVKLLLELSDRAASKEAGERYGDDTPRPTIPAKLGKKEAAQIEAEKAGVGSDWGNDLVPGGSVVN